MTNPLSRHTSTEPASGPASADAPTPRSVGAFRGTNAPEHELLSSACSEGTELATS